MFKFLAFLTLILYPCLISCYQNTSSCSSTSYFDTAIMNCNTCPTNEDLNTTDGMSCYCAPGYFIVDHNQIGFEGAGTCSACGLVPKNNSI